MSKKSERLTSIHKLIAFREKQEAHLLALAQKENKDNKEQKELLDEYREEYKANHPLNEPNSKALISRDRLLNYEAFLNNIGKAIQQQQEKLFLSDKRLTNALENWQRVHMNKLGVEKIRDELIRKERLAADKKEQKQIDDYPLIKR